MNRFRKFDVVIILPTTSTTILLFIIPKFEHHLRMPLRCVAIHTGFDRQPRGERRIRRINLHEAVGHQEKADRRFDECEQVLRHAAALPIAADRFHSCHEFVIRKRPEIGECGGDHHQFFFFGATTTTTAYEDCKVGDANVSRLRLSPVGGEQAALDVAAGGVHELGVALAQ